MKKQYKKFIFGETLQKAILQIPESEQLRFYRIIVDYGIDGVEPELGGFEAAVWVQMKDMIDNTMPAKRGAPEGNSNAKNKKINSSRIDLIDSNKTIKDELNQLKQINQFEKDENKYGNDNVNDNANENENEKEKGEFPLSFPPLIKPAGQETLSPEKNYAAVFEKVKSRWKEVIGQETRETLFTVSSAKRERFINTLAIYSLDDIFNAIGNYNLARSDPDEFEIGGRVYGNLIGFLENGVSQFFTDGVAESNFRRRKNDGRQKKQR
jgi:hypothetical protein